MAFNRYFLLAPVLLGLSVAFGLFHLGLEVGLGPQPSWLDDEVPVDWGYYGSFGQQVAGAEWEKKRHPQNSPDRWGVLLGASTIQRGPLPDALQEATDMAWLLLGIGGGTGAFDKLSRSQPTLRASGLRPNHIVLGIHPFWLAEPRSEDLPKKTEGGLWFIRNRKRVSNALHGRFQALREALFFQIGGTYAVHRPAHDPWAPAPERPLTEPLSAKKMTEHHELNAKAGRFMPASYRSDTAPVKGLRRYLAELGEMGAPLTLFLLPEHSGFQRRVPPEALAILQGALKDVPGAPKTTTVDLRTALPDTFFYDSYHLTMEGRTRLSALMAEHLKP